MLPSLGWTIVVYSYTIAHGQLSNFNYDDSCLHLASMELWARLRERLHKKIRCGSFNGMMFDNRHPDDVFMQQLGLLGLDLKRPQPVEHFFYFHKQDHAQQAAQKLRAEGYTPAVTPQSEESNWLVLARGRMVPAVELISRIQNRMDQIAASFDGHYDGWGTPGGN